MQTQSRLQGTTLTPERRELLLKAGQKLGLRLFEANLVIAIVQDRARAGAPLEASKPVLRLVRGPDESPMNSKCRSTSWPKWFAAAAGGAMLAALMIRWLSAG